MKKEQFCEFCGEALGFFDHYYGDGPLACGKAECNRYAREAVAAQQEDARDRAEQDGYSLYGGWGT